MSRFLPLIYRSVNHTVFTDVVKKNRYVYLSTSAASVDAVCVEMKCGHATDRSGNKSPSLCT